jgi:hypothetical protein
MQRSKWERGLVLVALTAVMGLAACTTNYTRDDEFTMPMEIQGMTIQGTQTGEEAAKILEGLHRNPVPAQSNVVTTYGMAPRQATIYLSRFAGNQEAKDQVVAMVEGIESGSSGFTSHDTVQYGKTQAHTVTGHGQDHAFFSIKDQVIWISVPAGMGDVALAQILGTEE